ncbi:hypothetical protein FB390_1593 [Nocardia bhagyanarayanae]|uniref:Uncharacterized protein n=1 Tax=Nocardia bhagyanarayanae TaxID=1215925 RepID=A0A543F817_9NOCA|nr:hypothetical protein FB390_1593 [Nocardia bhagyanarayanae]
MAPPTPPTATISLPSISSATGVPPGTAQPARSRTSARGPRRRGTSNTRDKGAAEQTAIGTPALWSTAGKAADSRTVCHSADSASRRKHPKMAVAPGRSTQPGHRHRNARRRRPPRSPPGPLRLQASTQPAALPAPHLGGRTVDPASTQPAAIDAVPTALRQTQHHATSTRLRLARPTPSLAAPARVQVASRRPNATQDSTTGAVPPHFGGRSLHAAPG